MKIISKIMATAVLITAFSSAHAATTLCDSVSMTPGSGSTGTITCQAHGLGNVEISSSDQFTLQSGGIAFGSFPATYGERLAYVAGQGTDRGFSLQGGDFSIASSVWSDWKSIYITIKQGNGSGGGGWAMFFVDSVVNSGTYLTKLNGTSGTGISHFFVVGGEKIDVSAVPLPAAVWLFGSAFIGLIGVAKKRTKAI